MVDAILFTPESLMEVSEKRGLSQKYAERWAIKIKNSHIRDALAAAIKAVNHYRHKFSQIEHQVQKKGLDIPLNEIQASVVKGSPIQRAIQQVIAKHAPSIQPLSHDEKTSNKNNKNLEMAPIHAEKLQKKIDFYREQIRQLHTSNKMLIDNSVKLEKRIVNLTDALEYEKQKTLEAITTDREFQHLRFKITRLHQQVTKEQNRVQILEEQLEIIQAFKKLEAKGAVILLKPIETFTREGIQKAAQLFSLQHNDAVILLDASGGGISTSKELLKHGIETVVTATTMSHQAEETFERFGVPVLTSKELQVEWISGYPYAHREKLSAAINRKISMKSEETSSDLAQIISQYQTQRTNNTHV
jgi:predicted RNase H-like nuclease (RuvC/YqgF family)